MAGGHIVAIEEGSATAVVPPALCAPAGQSTGAPGTIVLDAGPCNLMSMVAGKYTARLYAETQSGSPLAVAGCGTQADPLRFTLTLPETAGGANFTGAGITVLNGRVTQFVLPVMNVTTATNTNLTAQYNPTTGTINLTLTDPDVAAVKLPAAICDNSVNPTNGVLAGTPNTTYLLRVPNTTTTVYTATTSNAGAATINNMATGVYEVVVGTRSLGYMAYTRCTYVAP